MMALTAGLCQKKQYLGGKFKQKRKMLRFSEMLLFCFLFWLGRVLRDKINIFNNFFLNNVKIRRVFFYESFQIHIPRFSFFLYFINKFFFIKFFHIQF